MSEGGRLDREGLAPVSCQAGDWKCLASNQAGGAEQKKDTSCRERGLAAPAGGDTASACLTAVDVGKTPTYLGMGKEVVSTLLARFAEGMSSVAPVHSNSAGLA